jgi:hypothetical protein
MKSKGGDDVSLLKKIKNGVITMKDFTTILAMNSEKQQAIMAQLREVFDGHMTKATGNGINLDWKGKINLIAGVTEAIHVESDKFNKMGTRNLFYTMPEPDRKKTTRRSIMNKNTIKKKREELKDKFTEYINHIVEKSGDKEYDLPEKIVDNIIDVSDFVSMASTGVARNYRGEMQLALSANMPMRFATQSADLGTVFMAMNEGIMPEWGEKIIYKTLFDSIPKQRKMVLEVLARYRESTTRGVGMALGYSTDTVGEWLADLDALGIVKRKSSDDKGKIKWTLKEEYRLLFNKYYGIVTRDELFTGSENDSDYVEPGEQKEQDEETDAQFNLF